MTFVRQRLDLLNRRTASFVSTTLFILDVWSFFQLRVAALCILVLCNVSRWYLHLYLQRRDAAVASKSYYGDLWVHLDRGVLEYIALISAGRYMSAQTTLKKVILIGPWIPSTRSSTIPSTTVSTTVPQAR
jgi:hypothetical protein